MKSKAPLTLEQIEELKRKGRETKAEQLKRKQEILKRRYGDNIPSHIALPTEEEYWKRKQEQDEQKQLNNNLISYLTKKYEELFGFSPIVIKSHKELKCQGIIYGYKEDDFNQDIIINVLKDHNFTIKNEIQLRSPKEDGIPYFYIAIGEQNSLFSAFQSNNIEEYKLCTQLIANIHKLINNKEIDAILLASSNELSKIELRCHHFAQISNDPCEYKLRGNFLTAISSDSTDIVDDFIRYCDTRVFYNICSLSNNFKHIDRHFKNLIDESIDNRNKINSTQETLFKLNLAREIFSNVLSNKIDTINTKKR